MNKKNYTLTIIAVVAIAVLVIIGVFVARVAIPLLQYGDIYETTRINDYGKITGNWVNDEPEAFVHSFFPKQIEDSFTDIIYHYKAKKGDGYAYECYLELVIEDPDAYAAFIENTVDKSKCTPFAYDPAFQEQSISNVFYIWRRNEREAIYVLETAELGKILFSDEQQRVIFVALGMYDGGGATTIELNHFFSRFQIDPWEYMQTAYATTYYQKLDIPNKDREYPKVD